eukprot:TRINITY_DN4931_c0_g1_i7.p2 TRINITY_DN4931_c0_g1~~TRINITY_DN4931_c0_g1_i7.p2  ORF type:complete len:150 (-),score=14.43 TRINITY_DN4931_c0_g1_i7:72-521(-)
MCIRDRPYPSTRHGREGLGVQCKPAQPLVFLKFQEFTGVGDIGRCKVLRFVARLSERSHQVVKARTVVNSCPGLGGARFETARSGNYFKTKSGRCSPPGSESGQCVSGMTQRSETKRLYLLLLFDLAEEGLVCEENEEQQRHDKGPTPP